MDNQKSNDGNARDQGREGAGSSMGKDVASSRTSGTSAAGSSGSIEGASVGKEMSKDMSAMGNTDNNLSKSASDMHRTIDKAADAAQPAVDRLASSAHAGVDKVSGALGDASARMEEKSRQLSEAYRHFADTGRDYVRTSPATSLLVAVAAGFVLSKLLGRRY